MKKIMFSIIIPIYNAEKHIRQCVDSVLQQTYKNIEIILVDDGSPDNCPLICDEYSKKNNCIKVIHKENGGVASARNIGIENAEGEYLIFLDADDILVEGALESAFDQMKNCDLDIAICNSYVEMSEADRKVNCLFSRDILYNKKSSFETKVLCQNLSSMCIGIYRRTFLISNKLFVKEGITCGADTDFFFRTLVASKTVSIIDCTLFAYRYNENSVSNKLSYKNIRDVMYICSTRMRDLISCPSDQINNEKALNFFGTKYIHFSIKIATLKKEEKAELLNIFKQDKLLLKYAKAKPDKIFAKAVFIIGSKATITIFSYMIKIRNILKSKM